jgi:hypothetical protein
MFFQTSVLQSEIIDIYGRRLTVLKHDGIFLCEATPHQENKTLHVKEVGKGEVWSEKLETTTALPHLKPNTLYEIVLK